MPDPIPVKPANCDSPDPRLLSVEDAQARIMALAAPVAESMELPIRDALGLALAEAIISPLNVPPDANSAMDGYALRAADIAANGKTRLKLIGTAWAGRPFDANVQTGECVRIMTGAKLPEGADCVVMQEQVERQDDSIVIESGHTAGQNVRYPGEDIAEGSTVLDAGQPIGAAELGLLASLGISQVRVRRRLRVAFFSTGDELRPVGSKLEPGQIYDSNRYTLHGMLIRTGVELIDMGVIPDDPQAIETAFRDAAQQADAVITSGGVSVGEADFVKTTLDKLGQVDFWRIAMKPGKPLAIGKLGNAMFFGLPGNPVSVMATFYLFVLPALYGMMGHSQVTVLRVPAKCKHALKKQPGRMDFQRGLLSYENGELQVEAAGMQASHILSGMSRANCFIVLPRDSGTLEAGSSVEVLPFHGLMG
ncbi:MAG: molybdopterin molybdotransferase MoeA [Gammaproteobacteria bacterium]|jgi:molybdopterin molybdotransferase